MYLTISMLGKISADNTIFSYFCNRPHNSRLGVIFSPPSVRPSAVSAWFHSLTLLVFFFFFFFFDRFYSNFAYTCISGVSGLGLLMANGQLHKFLTELSAHHRTVFLSPDDNFSKYQLIFIQLGMCIDILEL